MDPVLLGLIPATGPEFHAFVVILLGVWAGTLGLPVPEEIPLLTAGIFAAAGILPLPYALLAGLIACFSADLFVFTVGRQIGGGLRQHRVLRRIMRGRALLRARHLYMQRGQSALFFARLLPGLKTPFIFTAGALHTPWSRFIGRDLASLAVLVPGLIGIGYSSHWSLGQLSGAVRGVATVASVLLVTAILIGIGVSYVNRRRFCDWRRRCVDAGIPVIRGGSTGQFLPHVWFPRRAHSRRTATAHRVHTG